MNPDLRSKREKGRVLTMSPPENNLYPHGLILFKDWFIIGLVRPLFKGA